jgi:hypothetical protein
VGAVVGVGTEKTEVEERDADNAEDADCRLKRSPATFNGAQNTKEARIYFMMVQGPLPQQVDVQQRLHGSTHS